jgi:hypothetical protein
VWPSLLTVATGDFLVSSSGFRRSIPDMACALRTAIDGSGRLDTVAQDAARAVSANWRDLVGCALEAIEGEALAVGSNYLKGAGVVVAADVANRHVFLLTWMDARTRQSVFRLLRATQTIQR